MGSIPLSPAALISCNSEGREQQRVAQYLADRGWTIHYTNSTDGSHQSSNQDPSAPKCSPNEPSARNAAPLEDAATSSSCSLDQYCNLKLVWGLPKDIPWSQVLQRDIWANRMFMRSGLIHKGKLCRLLKAASAKSAMLPESHIVTDIEDVEIVLRKRGKRPLVWPDGLFGKATSAGKQYLLIRLGSPFECRFMHGARSGK